MSTHKNIDRICIAVLIFSLLLTILFMAGNALGIQVTNKQAGYESRLFDTSKVHSIDIVLKDWDGFIENCENEEYVLCAAVIDGESYKNIGIRAKGNTSLSAVSSLGSQRYSFKIEFDHYDSGKSYYGLDKLSLNNIIQDNTYMKDYLSYRMMGAFGVAAPLCSYVYITVNGEDWGLYLAVESIEDSFLERNYGSDSGELYKPDSMDMGGGRGNGRDFNMDNFTNREDIGAEGDQAETGGNTSAAPETSAAASSPSFPDGADGFGQGGEGFDASENGAGGFTRPENGNFDRSEMPDMGDFDPFDFSGADGGMQFPGNMDGNMPGGMGSGASLQYVDDDPDNYSVIFDSAKTDITDADKSRLIASLKSLSEGENLTGVLDIDALLRYFVVHNYVVNGDSYTGSMVHNYYLYEKDGKLTMLPWDYNLAFGGFQAGYASSVVNDPIDSPLNVSMDGSKPMADWIFQSAEYTALYHRYFAEFLDTVDIAGIIDEAYGLIAPYVEKDPTAFCTYAEFNTAVDTLRSFCALRTESIRKQLDGSIPSTDALQSADSSSLVDTSGITISDMGSMNAGGMGGNMPGNIGGIQKLHGSTGETQLPNRSENTDGDMQIPDFGGGAPPNQSGRQNQS